MGDFHVKLWRGQRPFQSYPHFDEQILGKASLLQLRTSNDSPYTTFVVKRQGWVLVARGRIKEAEGASLLIRWPNEAWRALVEIRDPLAGVVFDPHQDRLWAFRSGLGLIPLWWRRSGLSLEFATRPDWISPKDIKPDKARASRFLFNDLTNDCSTRDFVEGLYRVRPGEGVLSTPRAIKTQRFFKLGSTEQEDRPFSEVVKELGQEIEASLAHATRDHPKVAATLSSGLDSSVVLALYLKKNPDTPAVTQYSETHPSMDERVEVRKIAEHLKVQHFTWPIETRPFFSTKALHILHPAWGPIFYPSLEFEIGFLRWAKQTTGRSHFITGLGGDEHFAISELKYLKTKLSRQHWKRKLSTLLRLSHPKRKRLLRELHAANPIVPSGLGSYLRKTSPAPWLSPGNWLNLRRVAPKESTTNINRYLQGRLWESIVRHMDFVQRLSKTEYINPFHDPLLWRFSQTIPRHMLRNDHHLKLPLRGLAEELLPLDIAAQPKEKGHYGDVFCGGLHQRWSFVEQVLINSELAQLGWLNKAALRDALDLWRAAYTQREKSTLSLRFILHYLAYDAWLIESKGRCLHWPC